MKIDITIEKVYPSRRGTSKAGNAYCMTDMQVKFLHKEAGRDAETHTVVATVSGELDAELVSSAVANKKVLTCGIYFDAREWAEDRAQTTCRIYLPEGYTIKPL